MQNTKKFEAPWPLKVLAIPVIMGLVILGSIMIALAPQPKTRRPAQ